MMGAEVTALGRSRAAVSGASGQRRPLPTLAEENRISARLVAPPRGRILDRFGTAVAGNKLNWRALLIAEQTEDVGLTLDNLARIVLAADNERVRIEREVHRHRRFIPTMVREFLTWDEMARIEVNAPDLPGILIDVGTTRVYPFRDKLAHIVGYVAPPSEADTTGDDPDPMLSLPGMRVGRAGIEKLHDEALRGRAGVVQLEVNAVGRVIRELDRQEGVPGTEIGLTVDSELQKRCWTGSEMRAPARSSWTAGTARCWPWPPTPRSIRAYSMPACRRRNGSSGHGIGGRRSSTARPRALRARLHVQDGGRAGGAGRQDPFAD